MNRHDYAEEKFTDAVYALAVGLGSIQERLRDAFVYSVVNLQPDDLPRKFRDKFTELHAAMSRVQDDKVGSAAASARAMADDEACAWAKWLVETRNLLALDVE